MATPALVIHGGAGRISPVERRADVATSLAAITAAVWPLLEAGGTALDAVVEAVRLLEDDPHFNAGTGSKLQADGVARMSASVMDGATERFAGVVNVEGLGNPVLLCRRLLDERDRVLSGAGALARARELGLPEKDVRTDRAIRAWEEARGGQTGTVGAVAVDRRGHVAAATSTGGRGMERVGRVSDSCTVAGNYASPFAAISLTGIGEEIVDGGLGVRLVAAVEGGLPVEEAGAALSERIARHGWSVGFIAVESAGRWTIGHSTESLAWRAITPAGARDFAG